MNFFPKPPTDNLYKHLAVTGAWLMFLIVVYGMFLGYLNYEIHRSTERLMHRYYADNMIREIEVRLENISLGKDNEGIIKNSRYKDGSKNEIDELKQLRKNHQLTLERLSNEKEVNYKLFFDIYKATAFSYISFIILVLASGCFVVGYTRWYTKVQKPEDEDRQRSAELKSLSIKKLKRELQVFEFLGKCRNHKSKT